MLSKQQIAIILAEKKKKQGLAPDQTAPANFENPAPMPKKPFGSSEFKFPKLSTSLKIKKPSKT